MQPFVLSEKPSIAHHFLNEMRHQTIQQDSMRFRRNMERLGEILAYEISKNMIYQNSETQTVLGLAKGFELVNQPVLVSVLRAGLPFYQGFLNFFDQAKSTFIGAYRGKHNADESFEIELHYIASPDLTDQTVILIDPMLATGKSFVSSYQALCKFGIPKKLHIAAAIGTPQGIELLQEKLPKDTEIWLGALDETLNQKFYIVPGLGDAGDLAYGVKL